MDAELRRWGQGIRQGCPFCPPSLLLCFTTICRALQCGVNGRSTVQRTLPLFFTVLLRVSNPRRFDFESEDGAGQQASPLADSFQQYCLANSIPLQQIIADAILVSHSLSQDSWEMERS